MTTTSPPSRPARTEDAATGVLVLVGSFVVALACVAVAVLWLVDESARPGAWLVVVPLGAVAALVGASFADTTWSGRPTRTTELGNTTRLLSLVAVLVAVPSVLLSLAGDDGRAASGSVASACPDDAVATGVFADVAPGGTHAAAVDCLAWWGVFRAEAAAFRPEATVTRAQVASVVDRLATAAGAGLDDAEPTFADVDGDAHAAAIGRVAAAGLLSGRSGEAFDPGGALNRDQAASLVARVYAHVAGDDLPAADDDRSTTSPAAPTPTASGRSLPPASSPATAPRSPPPRP